MNFFITDPDANAILQIERGVSGDAGDPRGADRRPRRTTEKKIIDYLDVVATSVGPLPPPPPKNAGELDRALRPAWDAIAFEQVDRRGRRQEVLRQRRGDPRARLSRRWRRAADSRQPGGARRPRSASASGAAWRRNARGLPLPAAVADRLLRPDARADARLALSLLHRLRPADPAALDRARQLRLRLLQRRAPAQRARRSPSPTCSGRCR